MNQKALLVLALLLTTTLSVGLATVVTQERKIKKVKRVKRPTFTQRDWDGIYFENLYAEGLVGDRPSAEAIVQSTSKAPTTLAEAGGGDEGGFSWSRYISDSTIENEVKALQNKLSQDITSPVKFKSDYAKVHQSFSILSMLFGVIREYDSDVRWQRFAPSAQASFERAAANSRVGTIQAYESCKRRKGDLAEMVRGGNFAGEEKPPETLDWAAVVERSPIMERLQVAYDNLKTTTSNKGDFEKNIDSVLLESEMVAAMAQTLMRENMTDADDDGYKSFAAAMSNAAVTVAQACKTKDYDGASQGVNLMGQSCSNCHDEWR